MGSVVPRPVLVERLTSSARVTVVSAPAGSGKTVLVRSWIEETSIDEHTAWVTVGRDGRDPQRFWLSVLDALRTTTPGSALVRAVTAAPDLDGWELTERVLTDLAALTDPVWLVLDDVHELGSTEVCRQLELLVMRAPPALRFVLITRHDVRLGLHRVRLDGELTEIRPADLRFSREEARQLLAASGVSASASAALWERTEGWAAGLRLAALSLAGHPDPERFVAEFSGGERTVAEYLLSEVLERQPDAVRELLLRTSVLGRVNGELADLLTAGRGGERILHDLEQSNAFVTAVDATRSWFRYHGLFADLLRLELRRTAVADAAELHRKAAGWFAEHGHAVEAIRHAQAARDWPLATRLLAEHGPVLHLDGQATTARDLLAGFPDDVVAADGVLTALFAVDELVHGSVDTAQRYLDLAERAADSTPSARLLLGIVRLMLARRRGNLSMMADRGRQVREMLEAQDLAWPGGLAEDLRAFALISLDSAEYWTASFVAARQHLELGRALAQRLRRPYLEFSGLAYQAANEFFLSFPRAADHGTRAVDLADRHGWTEEPAAGVAYMTLGAVRAWQGRLDESETWVQRAERTIRADAQPLAGLGIRHVRATLEMAHGRDTAALAAFHGAEQLVGLLAEPTLVTTAMRALHLQAFVRAGQTQQAERALADLDEHDRDSAEMRITLAMLRLAQADPHAATAALVPVLDGTASVVSPTRRTQAFLLEAIARDALGEPGDAERALERALDLAEPDGALIWFLLHPTPSLLSRHTARRTRHASLIAEIQNLLAGRSPVPAPSTSPPLEPLSDSEIRVLRYLPTNLTAPEIAVELSVSPNTVKTHLRNLYHKLGAHRRAEAVARARALGLLAPFTHRR